MTIERKDALGPVGDGGSSLLFLELGSVSFKASLVPKDARNRIMETGGHGASKTKTRKLKNLACLEVYRRGALSEDFLARTVKWLKEIASWASRDPRFPPDEVLVVATAAFRDIGSYAELEQAVGEIFNAPIHLLDGFVEAQLLVNGCGISSHRTHDFSTTLFDLGGGSLELVCLQKGAIQFTSLQLGAGRVTAWLMDGHPLREVRARIREEFSQKCESIRTLSSRVWLGTGGAVRSFRKAFQPDRDEPIKAFDVTREFERMKTALSAKKGGSLGGAGGENGFQSLLDAAPVDLPPHRRKIYVGGLIALHCICTHFKVSAVKLERASVKNGVLALLQLLRPTPLAPPRVLTR